RFTPAIIRRDAFGRPRRIRVVVAELERRVVGYAATIDGYNTDLAAPENFMLDLFVEARWRSHGIGRALVATVARETVRRRLGSLQWGVRADNARARRFYRGLGARIGKGTGAALLTGRSLVRLAAAR
ncbi:MAG TPA: GNAT family N-acetyltransferase, partial [Methylomirabilota bacterium]|nr:GNAT family N-acetyltransferase [Methylomirabilota bacterium]